jgi:protein gp37
MPAKTKIEWADYISNPIKAKYTAGPYALNGGHVVQKQGHACVKISEGCTHCWASNFNVRLGTGLGYVAQNFKKVEMFLDEKEMERIRKFKPRLPKGAETFKNGRSRPIVFPCDMTDLFGEWVSGEWLDRIFQAMWMCQDVDWFVLTKRTDRMLDYLASKNNAGKIVLNNIYIGCTVENQKRANERRGAMDSIAWMGWKTWVSFEPALEMVNWDGWQFLKGLVCGGESGFSARPMPPEAAREARYYCNENGIPYFFKQWGEWAPLDHLAWVNDGTTFKTKPMDVNGTMMAKVGKGLAGRVLDGHEWNEMPK